MIKTLKTLFIYFTNLFRKREQNTWVFGEWFGTRCCDNSCYFANFVADNHPDIHVYWITDSQTDLSRLSKKIHVAIRDSSEACNVLKRCSVAIMSQDLSDFSSKRYNYTSGALVVQLWHGIPWKRIGFDASRSTSLRSRLYILWQRLFYSADLFLSPSDYFDLIVFFAFCGRKDQIIHSGYPRNLLFYKNELIDTCKKKIVQYLYRLNPQIDYSSCRIISYMPTFRNNSDDYSLFDNLSKLSSFVDYLEQTNTIFVYKTHYVKQTRSVQSDLCISNRFFYISYDSGQELLCATDLLITDYSGSFFDYLILDRPIIHYLYDYEYYRTLDRGLYYDKEDVIAGEEVINEPQLVDAIMRNLDHPALFKERRDKIKKEYLKYDTNNSCEILYQEIYTRLLHKFY